MRATRAGDIVLLLLAFLIASAPLLWIVGVALPKVAGAVLFWAALWLVVSMVGRRYER